MTDAAARPDIPGLIVYPSRHEPRETLDRLSAAVAGAGMEVFARVDHAAAASAAGLSLDPATVLIFGAARAGTPLMRAAPTLAIDLPLRALVWQDAKGRTWVAYNDPRWLAQRHGVGAEHEPVLARMDKALAQVVETAAEQGATR